ncbi:FAD binding domain-containing protein [Clostridium malenominatum]|uniref:FAD binding domain-containing protein n=1 Tax=Clostridium malenominatum TaxID=1539 RepID=A0ABN1J3S2_9CLOT
MFTVIDLVQPQTLEEAYNILVSRKNNTVLGGCAFLKMGSKRIGTAIELSKLDLNYIKETEGYIEVGASTTLRDIETSSLLKNYFSGVLVRAVGDIIGIQFRNVVNIGATVFSKYGFSDVITALLALDTEVELYKGGRMSLEEFLQRPYERDILTRIFIKKNARKAVYNCFRNSSTDYPILNLTVSKLENQWKIVVGARPATARIALEASELISKGQLNEALIEEVAQKAVEELNFGSNMRGSAEYRRAICKVLIKRTLMEVVSCK